MNRLAYLLITTFFALAFPFAAWGEEPSNNLPAKVFEELIDVRSIDLEVVVEDRRGRRVEGLGADDFRLLVDGEEVAIDFFSEVVEEGGKVDFGSSGGTPRSESAEGNTDRGTSYLLFIDELFVSKRDRNRILRELSSQLNDLGPKDRMSVVTFDGVDLVAHGMGTESPEELRALLESLMERRAQGESTRRILHPLLGVGAGQPPESLIFELTWRLREIAAAAAASLRAHSRLPGRKVMLLAAGDWPLSPTRYAYNSFDQVDDRQEERLLEPIHRTANLLGYTLYPIDAKGIAPSAGPDVTAALPPSLQSESFDRDTTSIFVADQAPEVYRNLREEESHASFRLLAAETGGKPLLDSARLTAFRRVVKDTRSYYWMGFSPHRKRDDGDHELDVQVLRPGLRVRHRLGYQDLSREAESSFLVESALLLGQVTGADMRVEFGEPKRKSRRIELPVKFFFPLDSLTFVETDGAHVAELQLRIAAVDDKGRRSRVDVIPVVLAMAQAPEPGVIGVREVIVTLRNREQDIVFSLLDTTSGSTLSSKEHLTL